LVAERTDQLAAEKELISVTLASLTDGVIVVDTEKRIVLLNPVAENLTDVRYDYIKGHLVSDVFQLVDERNGGPLESPIDCVLNSQGTGPATKCGNLIGKNGSECPVAAAAAPIRTGNGPVMGVVMVLHDLRQEREIDRMKTDFISSVSHELRTPLTSIRAYTATILRDRNITDKTKYDFLAVILEETERLTNLVNQLLEVSHLESGTVRIVRESVDIPAVVEQVVTALELLAQDKNIQLETDVCDQLPILLGDKDKIQSIISNLLSNAIKFTPQGGRVSVSVRQQTDELLIRVSDTGVGIPREELPRIFERFYRGRRTSEQVKGTGLGLAIVKELVTMHGGRVGVESEPGRGTTFTVVLPVAGEPQLEPVAG
jgi:PAS domain S-box-containing protein